MERAAIVIGVDRTGDLPVLRDAAQGARRFEQWSRSQGIDGERLIVLTDENGGSVTIDAIKQAVDKIVGSDNPPDQLIIYFAGHGVNIGYGEYWLLSDAPRNSQAAVNVAGSEVLARHCGIAHVLMVSDACRTAAEGVRAQRVTGSEIFPNLDSDELENPVDQFFACTLGRPSMEVRDPNTTAKEFRALYTTAFLCGINGLVPELLMSDNAGEPDMDFVHPRPLKAWLTKAVTRRISALDLQTKAIQVPDARIASDPQAWIARVPKRTALPMGDCMDYIEQAPPTRRGARSQVAPTTASISASLLRSALRGGPRVDVPLTKAEGAGTFEAAVITEAVKKSAVPFGPAHHETQCGFKIRGARIVDVFATGAAAQLLSVPGDDVRVQPLRPQGANVLLVLESGQGALLPALPEFMTALSVVDGELVDVAYEPSENTQRWNDFVPRAEEIRRLRSIASVSSRNGVFRLEGDDALALAQRMQLAKGADPSLAIYASYAYNELRRKDLLREMSGYMRDGLGGRFFDVAMHAGELDGKRVSAEPGLLSFLPLMTQGWALIGAHRIALPASLEGLRECLTPSLWTLFDRSGVERIRAAMQQGELP